MIIKKALNYKDLTSKIKKFLAAVIVMAIVINMTSIMSADALDSNRILKESKIIWDKKSVRVKSSIDPVTMMLIASALPLVQKGVNAGINSLSNWIKNEKLSQIEKAALQKETAPEVTLPQIQNAINQLQSQINSNTQAVIRSLNDSTLNQNILMLSAYANQINNIAAARQSLGADAAYKSNGKQILRGLGIGNMPVIIDNIKDQLFGAGFGGQGNISSNSLIMQIFNKTIEKNEYIQNNSDLLKSYCNYYAMLMYSAAYLYMDYCGSLCVDDNGNIDSSKVQDQQLYLNSVESKVTSYSNILLSIPPQRLQPQDCFDIKDTTTGNVTTAYNMLIDNKNGYNLWYKKVSQGSYLQLRNKYSVNLDATRSNDGINTVSAWYAKHPKLKYTLKVPTIAELKTLLQQRESDFGSNWVEILINRGFNINGPEVLVANTEYTYNKKEITYSVYNINSSTTRQFTEGDGTNINILWISRDISVGDDPVIPISGGSNWDFYGQIIGYENKQKLTKDTQTSSDSYFGNSKTWGRTTIKESYTAPAGSIITRIEILCGRGDGHQGSYLISQGGLGQSSIEISFESDPSRAQSWQMRVYTSKL